VIGNGWPPDGALGNFPHRLRNLPHRSRHLPSISVKRHPMFHEWLVYGAGFAACGRVQEMLSRRGLMSDPQHHLPSHPIGTLAIVGLYGALFALGWLAVYVWVYLARGPVR
jgi:hypothetical protein